MDYKIKKEVADEVLEGIKILEDLLTERIADLHKVQGGMQARHAYCYYRRVLCDAKYLLRDNLKETWRL